MLHFRFVLSSFYGGRMSFLIYHQNNENKEINNRGNGNDEVIKEILKFGSKVTIIGSKDIDRIDDKNQELNNNYE